MRQMDHLPDLVVLEGLLHPLGPCCPRPWRQLDLLRPRYRADPLVLAVV